MAGKKHSQKDSIVLKTYHTSIVEGSFAQVYGSLAQIGSSFVTKLMVIMGASPMQYSLLSGIGQASAIWQPLGIAISRKISQRKWLCIWISALGRLLTLFLGLALVFKDQQQGIWFMLMLLFFSAGLQSTGANIWIAWISDIIPLRIRGRFFSRRNQILLIVGLAFSYLVSFHVDLFESKGGSLRVAYISFLGAENFFVPGKQSLFLAFVFVFAALMGVAGLSLLALQPERKRRSSKQSSLRVILRQPFMDKNFRLLLIFGVWWMLAVGIGSPFWSPFMLKKLQMSLFEIQIYSTIHTMSSLLSFGFWGKFIDHYGNKSSMKICVMLGGLNPLFWLFVSSSNYSLLWLEGLISGFMWAGAGIITTNFVLSIAPKGKAQAYSGIYAAVAGLAMMTSSLASGVFYPGALDLGFKVLEPEQVMFGIGGIARWLTIIPLALVHEPRSIPLRKALAFTMARIYSWRFRSEKRG
ncbi:MAG: MFS transporter [Candidatus Stygibacter frigidus]|nr:MFS transporter [Candidatus Stygibacter frigidus]